MRIWPNVECRTTLPDDQIEEDGKIVRLPGENVAAVVGELLAARGYEISPPESAGDNGWEFEVRRDRHRFWIQVAVIYERRPILQTRDVSRLAAPRTGQYLRFLSDLHKALTADPRFSKLRWWAKTWPIEKGEGVPHPFMNEDDIIASTRTPAFSKSLLIGCIVSAAVTAFGAANSRDGWVQLLLNALFPAMLVWFLVWFLYLREEGGRKAWRVYLWLYLGAVSGILLVHFVRWIGSIEI